MDQYIFEISLEDQGSSKVKEKSLRKENKKEKTGNIRLSRNCSFIIYFIYS